MRAGVKVYDETFGAGEPAVLVRPTRKYVFIGPLPLTAATLPSRRQSAPPRSLELENAWSAN